MRETQLHAGLIDRQIDVVTPGTVHVLAHNLRRPVNGKHYVHVTSMWQHSMRARQTNVNKHKM